MSYIDEELSTENMDEQDYDQLLEIQKQHIAKKRMQRKQREKYTCVINTCILIIIAIIVAVVLFVMSRKDETVFNPQQLPAMEEPADTTQEKAQKNKAEKSFETEENINVELPEEYKEISYSNAVNLERYEKYRKDNPNLSLEDVVWMVNAHQDKPKYEYDIDVSGYDDPYVIVNKYYKVNDGYEPPDLVECDGEMMRRETAEAYKEMKKAAADEGFNFYVVDGYRSTSVQRGLYEGYLEEDSKENVDRYSARPGYSEHHTGMALDIFGSSPGLREFENTPEYPWVRDNAYKYGFIIRYLKETESITGYESEPWHIRYVGKEVSTKMKENNIKSFEEYHAKFLEN